MIQTGFVGLEMRVFYSIPCHSFRVTKFLLQWLLVVNLQLSSCLLVSELVVVVVRVRVESL